MPDKDQFKYVRTKLTKQLHGELKKLCAVNSETMQDYVADLISVNVERQQSGRRALAMRVAELDKEEVEELLKQAIKYRNNNA